MNIKILLFLLATLAFSIPSVASWSMLELYSITKNEFHKKVTALGGVLVREYSGRLEYSNWVNDENKLFNITDGEQGTLYNRFPKISSIHANFSSYSGRLTEMTWHFDEQYDPAARYTMVVKTINLLFRQKFDYHSQEVNGNHWDEHFEWKFASGKIKIIVNHFSIQSEMSTAVNFSL